MLDIDLDFFGIIYVFQFFLDVGMFIVFLNMMNGVFWKLFCLKIVKEEQETDRVLVKVLRLFQNVLDCKIKL